MTVTRHSESFGAQFGQSSIGGVRWSTLYAMNSTSPEHECANASRGLTRIPLLSARFLLITVVMALLATAIARGEPLLI